MRQSIRGYTDGIVEQAGAQQGAVAAELAAVRQLVDGSEDLRRTLLDPGVPAAARRAVLTDLLSGKVSADTLRLLVFAVDSDRPTESVGNLAWLETRMQAGADDLHSVSDIVLGQKAAEERIDGYASALLEKVEGDGTLTRIEDELFSFLAIIHGSDDLRAAVTDRDIPTDARCKLVADLLRDRAYQTTTRLAVYAAAVGRPRDFPTLIEHLIERVAAETNRRLADVRSAVEMDEAQRQHLAAALKAIVGRDVHVRVTVDPSLLAGFVAIVGDTVVDGSARHRLEILKERLVLPEVRVTTGEPN